MVGFNCPLHDEHLGGLVRGGGTGEAYEAVRVSAIFLNKADTTFSQCWSSPVENFAIHSGTPSATEGYTSLLQA